MIIRSIVEAARGLDNEEFCCFRISPQLKSSYWDNTQERFVLSVLLRMSGPSRESCMPAIPSILEAQFEEHLRKTKTPTLS
jgi:hypothetical protein